MATAEAVPSPIRNTFLRDRLASWLAFFPLGVWTFFHLKNNLAAADGAMAWQTAVTHYSSPFTLWATTFIVVLPLVLHTLWGFRRLRTTRPNNGRYNWFANFKYLLQRISAVGVLLFIGAHMWLAFLHPRFVEGHPEPFMDIAREMHHHMPTLLVYLLGTLGVTYHFGNGLFSIAFMQGTSDASIGGRVMQWLSIGAFLLMLAMAWGAIYLLYQAGA